MYLSLIGLEKGVDHKGAYLAVSLFRHDLLMALTDKSSLDYDPESLWSIFADWFWLRVRSTWDMESAYANIRFSGTDDVCNLHNVRPRAPVLSR